MGEPIKINISEDTRYTGVYFQKGAEDMFWSITCPCGVEVTFPVNELPEVTTLHPCGKSNHWTVEYELQR